MFRIQSWSDSTTNRGTIPQGKGREGIRKGRGMWLRFIHDLRLLAAEKRMDAFGVESRGAR